MSKNTKKNTKKSKKQNIKKTKKISIRQKGGKPNKIPEPVVNIEDKLFISRFLNTNRDKNIFNDNNINEINKFLFQMYDKLDRDKLDKYYNSMKVKDVDTKDNQNNILNEIEIMKINNENKNSENKSYFSPEKDSTDKYMLTEVINDINGRIPIFLIKDNNSMDDIIITYSDSDKPTFDNENQHIANIKLLLTKLNEKIEKKDNKIINPFILQMLFQGTIGTTSTVSLNKKLLNCKGIYSAIRTQKTKQILIIDTPKNKIIKLNLYIIVDNENTVNPIYIAQRSYIIADLYIQDDDNNFVENIINNNLFFGKDSSTPIATTAAVPAANPAAPGPNASATPATNPAAPTAVVAANTTTNDVVPAAANGSATNNNNANPATVATTPTYSTAIASPVSVATIPDNNIYSTVPPTATATENNGYIQGEASISQSGGNLKKQCNLIIVNILDKNIIEYCK